MKRPEYSEKTYYWLKEDELSIEEFINLSYTAGLINEYSKHKIFFAWDGGSEDAKKVFTSLN